MDCRVTEGSSSKGGRTSLVCAGLRAALAGGAALAMVLAALGSADAALQNKPPHAKREQPKKEPPPKPLEMPLIEISISKQQLTLFEKGAPVAHAPVSTGMAGHLTPTGIFSVLEKEIFHRSNIYSGAPMPHMQRITWSGVAMHAGVLPGYPASHGCIRLPADFATKLYGLTQRGARVLVMPHEVVPVPFENAKLFIRPKPLTDKTSEVTLPVPGMADSKPANVVRTAESQSPGVMSDAVSAAAHALSGMARPKPAEAAAVAPPPMVTEPPQVSEPPAAPAAAVATANPAPAEPVKEAAALPAQKAPSEPDNLKDAAATAATEAIEEASKYSTAAGPAAAPASAQSGATRTAAASGSETNAGEGSTGTVVVKPIPVIAPQPIEVQRTFEPANVPRNKTQTFEPVPTTPAAQPAQAAPAAQPGQAAQPAPAPEAMPAPAAAAAVEYYGPERPLRPGPITVFVSKKEGRLFVRKGFLPVFSWPVKFVHPEQPLGTHLFTAVEANPDGVSFRWQLVSVPVDLAKKPEVRVSRDKKGQRVETVTAPPVAPRPATAAEALERVDIPPVALSRISALMSTGASLIISDQGLGSETGTETDFIVLTR